jgi:hypothetical protein
MPLCQSCQRFDIQRFATAPYRTQGFKLTRIERAAEQESCEFCRFICRALHDAREAWKQPQMTTELWVHLRMSKDNDWKSSDARPLHFGLQFNRLDLYICPRHVMITDSSVDDLDMIQGAVTCRVLADQGTLRCRFVCQLSFIFLSDVLQRALPLPMAMFVALILGTTRRRTLISTQSLNGWSLASIILNAARTPLGQ